AGVSQHREYRHYYYWSWFGPRRPLPQSRRLGPSGLERSLTARLESCSLQGAPLPQRRLGYPRGADAGNRPSRRPGQDDAANDALFLDRRRRHLWFAAAEWLRQ